MNHIVLNEGQARFLCDLSRASANYRGSWESIIERGQKEVENLENAQWVNGPSHQIMAEVQQEYGQIKALLNIVWSVFSVASFNSEEAKAEAKTEIDNFLKIAMGKPSKHGSMGGGTWFSEGRTVSDYL